MPDPVFTGATRNFTFPAESTFVAPPDAGASAKELAALDVNGDGKLDVLISYIRVSEDRATPLRVMLGDGGGGFTDGTSTVFGANVPAGVFVRQLVTADFNGDGRTDVFASDHGFDGPPFPGFQNGLLLSNGPTGFANATANLPQVSDFSHSAAAADIDHDGDIDIFVANLSAVGPYFLINDGHGGFTRDNGRIPSSAFAAGAAPSTVLFFDADGDGRPDLLLGDVRGTAGSTILHNDGSGQFTSTLTVAPGSTEAIADALDAHALDLNGDGRLDLVLAYTLNNDQAGRLQILMNQPGGFVDETAGRMAEPDNATAFVRRVQIVDLNGDGAPDIVDVQDSDRPVYLNDGTGHFVRMPVGFVPGNRFDDITVGDFNGDGRMDIFAVRNQTNYVLYLGRDPGLTQTGTDAADGFMGDGDAETLSGLGGDDVIFGAGGNDSVTAGAGNDTVSGGAGTNYLRGDEGNDSIVGGAGFDDINGNMGNDTCVSGGGDDWVVGGKDNDSLVGSDGANLVYGNIGADTCDGGAGNDIVRGGQDNDVVLGGAGDDFVSGDKGDDTMTGGAGADSFHTFGDAGIDRVLDFHISEGDRVQLDPGTQFTVSQVGADTVINMTGGGQMILVGVQMSSLTGSWIFGA